jgi:hypothetical protein
VSNRLIVDLAIVDELHAHKHDELYVALRTAMQKRPGARMVTITTAGARVQTPLGALRDRALKLPHVRRSGALTRAVGDNMASWPGSCRRAPRSTTWTP